MNKIKILHIGLTSNLGGIEKYLYNMHQKIDHNSFKLDYLVFKGEKVCFYDEIIKKSNIHEIVHRKENYVQFLKDLKKFMKNSEYDYIHFHLMEFSCFEMIVFAKKYTKSKIILHSHIAEHKISSLKTKILNWIGKKVLLLGKDNYLKTACSIDAGKFMFNSFKNSNFKVLNNGIEISNYVFSLSKRKEIRNKLKLNEDDVLIGNIGRFVEQKNHKDLIKIFSKLTEKKSNFKLLIIGKGQLKKQIIKMSVDMNVFEKIIFIENTDDIQGYLSAMDLFVFPSLFEGLGIVLIEAQASGLKCFVTDSLPNEINISQNVYRISLNNLETWVKEILKNDFVIENRKEENKKVLDSYFDINKTIEVLESYYKNKIN